MFLFIFSTIEFWHDLCYNMSEMSSSDDDDRIPACDWCGDDRGQCDRPHLVDDRCFSVKFDEAFDFETVCNTASLVW